MEKNRHMPHKDEIIAERELECEGDKELDAFLDECEESISIDGLPRANNEMEAEAMADIRPYLAPKDRLALKRRLWSLIQSWMDAERENGGK